MMKGLVFGTAALVLAAGSAVAAPKHYGGDRGFSSFSRGHVTAWERAQIARSAAQVARVKRQAYRDGRVTRWERVQIRQAEARHQALIARARRS